MATITGFTASRMLAMEAATIIGGTITGNNLILKRKDGSTLDAGVVKGAPGTNGVTPVFRALSATSTLIEKNSKTFVISPSLPIPFPVDSTVKASSSANPNNYMTGYVTSSSNTSMTINVSEVGGSGTFSDWVLTLSAFQGPPGSISVSPAGGSLVGNYPNPTLAPNSVGTENIANGSVTRDKLAPGASVAGIDLITPCMSASPIVMAHRGGHSVYPENTLEGFREIAKTEFPVEVDVQLLSSGHAVAIHDTTVDRTMSGTGSVSSMDLSMWKSMTVKPQIPGGQYGTPTVWSDVVRELGGRALLVPEIKVAGQQDPIMAPVIAANLQRAVIFQSFDLATAQAVVAAGCEALYLSATALSTTTPAALKAMGINFLGYNSGVSASDVQAAVQAGLKVIMYTVDTAAAYNDAITTKGAHGVFSNDPWFVSGRHTPKSSDPFKTGDAWPHLVGYNSATGPLTADTLCSSRIQYAPPRSLRRYNYFGTDGGGSLTVAMGWAGRRRGPNLRVSFTLTFLETSASQTRWVGMYLGSQASPDDCYHDAAYPGQNGYHFLVRRNGSMDIYRVAPSTAPASIGTTTGSVVAASGMRSQQIRYMITVDGTTVSVRNLTDGTVASANNTAFRGLCQIDLTSNGTDFEISDIGVEDL